MKDEYAEKILQLFEKEIHKYAAINSGRKHYEYIATIFKAMKKIKNGNITVKKITNEFRITYKRRPAMIEILKDF